MKEYQIKLYSGGKFSHNVYVVCKEIKQVGDSFVIADGVGMDFILHIFSIKENI